MRECRLGVTSCLLQHKTGVANLTPLFDSAKYLDVIMGTLGF